MLATSPPPVRVMSSQTLLCVGAYVPLAPGSVDVLFLPLYPSPVGLCGLGALRRALAEPPRRRHLPLHVNRAVALLENRLVLTHHGQGFLDREGGKRQTGRESAKLEQPKG